MFYASTHLASDEDDNFAGTYMLGFSSRTPPPSKWRVWRYRIRVSPLAVAASRPVTTDRTFSSVHVSVLPRSSIKLLVNGLQCFGTYMMVTKSFLSTYNRWRTSSFNKCIPFCLPCLKYNFQVRDRIIIWPTYTLFYNI